MKARTPREIICVRCGRKTTTLGNGKYCNDCRVDKIYEHLGAYRKVNRVDK